MFETIIIKKMKYSLLILAIAINSIAFASNYKAIYYLDKSSINFVENKSNPSTPPVYGEWENVDDVFDCTSWTPSRGTVTNGTSFNQSRNCQQAQKRTVTNSDVSEESRNITVSDVQTATGTLTCNPFNISNSSMISYGSVNNLTGVLENPNYGTRMSWNGYLIFGDLNQTLKSDRTEIVVDGYVYKRQSFVSSRNITFEGYNYKTYDYSVCRYPVE